MSAQLLPWLGLTPDKTLDVKVSDGTGNFIVDG
jgi:hypothetical protein